MAPIAPAGGHAAEITRGQSAQVSFLSCSFFISMDGLVGLGVYGFGSGNRRLP